MSDHEHSTNLWVMNADSSVWAFFKEISYNGDPCAVRVQEPRDPETRIVGQSEEHTSPYAGGPARK